MSFCANRHAVPTRGPISQSAFLHGMGLEPYIQAAVTGTKSSERKAAIQEAARRLVDSGGMGREYMVLGIGGHVDDEGKVYPFDL